MIINNSVGATAASLSKELRSTSTTKSASQGDEVKLSSLSEQLRATDEEAPFDTAKVAEIKQAISEGKFSINAEAIADRLISSAQELIDTRQSA